MTEMATEVITMALWLSAWLSFCIISKKVYLRESLFHSLYFVKTSICRRKTWKCIRPVLLQIRLTCPLCHFLYSDTL